MPATKAAFFDIDGTLVRGLLIVDFPRYLSREQLFDRTLQGKICELARLYQRGKVSYRYISTRIPRLYAAGIRGLTRSEVLREAKAFMHESRSRILPYSERLVSLMAKRGFFTVAVSGSPIEVLVPLRKLGFRKIFGTETETQDGRYTGKVQRNLILAEEKKKLVDTLVREQGVDTEGSYAFGDTDQDVPLLHAVGNPVVLNPNPVLRRYAARKGWLVPRHVVEDVEALLASA